MISYIIGTKDHVEASNFYKVRIFQELDYTFWYCLPIHWKDHNLISDKAFVSSNFEALSRGFCPWPLIDLVGMNDYNNSFFQSFQLCCGHDKDNWQTQFFLHCVSGDIFVFLFLSRFRVFLKIK